MTDTSGTPILTAPVIAPLLRLLRIQLPLSKIRELLTPLRYKPGSRSIRRHTGCGVLKNATPIPESLKTALQQPKRSRQKNSRKLSNQAIIMEEDFKHILN